MGLFGNKAPCAICAGKVGLLKGNLKSGEVICSECKSKLDAVGINASKVNFAEAMAGIEKLEADRKAFETLATIGRSNDKYVLQVDRYRQLWRYGLDRNVINAETFAFEEMIGMSVYLKKGFSEPEALMVVDYTGIQAPMMNFSIANALFTTKNIMSFSIEFSTSKAGSEAISKSVYTSTNEGLQTYEQRQIFSDMVDYSEAVRNIIYDFERPEILFVKDEETQSGTFASDFSPSFTVSAGRAILFVDEAASKWSINPEDEKVFPVFDFSDFRGAEYIEDRKLEMILTKEGLRSKDRVDQGFTLEMQNADKKFLSRFSLFIYTEDNKYEVPIGVTYESDNFELSLYFDKKRELLNLFECLRTFYSE
ncbi:MAG: hypothetical protein ACRCUS_04375 [Anaerovoracaceae bacterium]